jgi:hypothetical protein
MNLEMEFAVDWLVIFVDKFEGVTSVSVHTSVAVWRASIGEQEGHLVGGLRPQGDEVPEHVRVLSKKKKIKKVAHGREDVKSVLINECSCSSTTTHLFMHSSPHVYHIYATGRELMQYGS